MKISIRNTLLLLFLLVTTFSYSQQFVVVENAEKSSAFFSEQVINTVNSSSGYLFLATKRGILKYDGYRFIKIFDSKVIWSTLQIRDSFIYFHDADGLFQMNINTNHSECILKNEFMDSDPNNDHFENVFIDWKGRIWGTDFNYIKYYIPQRKELKSFLLDADNKSIDRYSIIQPAQNEIWIASKNGLFVWNENTNKIQLHPNKEINQLKFSSSFLANKNEVFLGTTSGVVLEINPLTNKYEQLRDLPDQESALGFFSLGDSVFIYSSKRIYKLRKNGYSEIYSSGGNVINSVSGDSKTGIIWVSTEKGLMKLSTLNPAIEVIRFLENDSLQNNVISIVYLNKSIWVLTDAGSIWTFKNSIWSLVYKNETHKNNKLQEVDGQLILSNNKGIQLWNGKSFENILIKNWTPSEIIKVLKIAPKEAWLVYAHKKIERYSWPDFKALPDRFTNDESFWKENKWNDILVDQNGHIWLAGWMPKGFGITLYDPVLRQFQDLSAKKFNNNKSVFVGDYYNRIGLTKGSDLLFSAYGGFNKVGENGKVIQKIDVHDYPIIDQHIEGISEDASGNVFFATGEGLHVYRKDINNVVRISKLDGMPTDYLLNAYSVLPDGRIAMGINGGIVILNPELIFKSQLQNKLKLSQIKINGLVKSSSGTHIELSKKETDVTLYFSNLSFLDPKKTTYQYRFDQEENWQDLGSNPELSLNHISPGTYHIYIRSQDNLQNIQDEMLELSILAHPPFLKSNLFYFLIFILILFIVIIIQRYLSKRKQKEISYLQKIKEIEMQMLRSQMNPHFMFNTLNSINSYIIQNKTDDASAYLTTFSKLMRSILQNSKEQMITLENELNTLRLYIELESARLEHSFSYSINVGESISETDILVPPLIIQPFVENAIWHGLRNKSNFGHLFVAANINSKKELKIIVQDNGVGREKSANLKNNLLSHKSFGIDITLERLKLLDENNNIEIDDLYDSNDISSGTKVTITLKIKEND